MQTFSIRRAITVVCLALSGMSCSAQNPSAGDAAITPTSDASLPPSDSGDVGDGPVTPEAGPQSSSAVGTNLNGLVYWSTEWVLNDLMKSAGGWYTQGSVNGTWQWDTGEQGQLDLDADGWVRSLPASDSSAKFRVVSALMRSNSLPGAYPDGQYTVLYDGQGMIEYDFAAKKNIGLSKPGRDVLDVKGDGGILLRITKTDPNDYIRNIRVLLPQADESQRFHAKFLADMKRYRVVRFLNVFDIPHQPTGEWSKRTKPSYARWNGPNGAPIDLAFELANASGADPWIPLPFAVSDEYARESAKLAKATLSPQRQVYLEYSNEVWNFAQPFNTGGTWIENKAKSEWPNSTRDPYRLRLNWYAKRTIELCRIWKGEFGDQAQRVKCVLSAQAGSTTVGKEVLDCPEWAAQTGKACGAEADAFAVAPYFGLVAGKNMLSTIRGWTQQPGGGLDQLFESGGPDWAKNNSYVKTALGYVDANRALAQAYQLPLITYEGGQHFVFLPEAHNEPDVKDFFIQANRDARMGELYRAFLAGWKERGGQLFVHFMSTSSFDKWGSWGAKEYQNQDEVTPAAAPKYKALIDFIDSNPCWWTGCN
jgi:hypothetical protein